MDSQLDAVRDKICKAEDEIVETKQQLATARQAGNQGGCRGGEVSSWPTAESQSATAESQSASERSAREGEHPPAQPTTK